MWEPAGDLRFNCPRQDNIPIFFTGWCEHAPLVSNIKAAPGCGRRAIRFVHPVWVRELFLQVWYKIDDTISNNIINLMLLCWSLLYLLDKTCFEKASSFKQENPLTATTRAYKSHNKSLQTTATATTTTTTTTTTITTKRGAEQISSNLCCWKTIS